MFHPGVKRLDTGRQDNSPHVYFQLLRGLVEIDGVCLAYAPADVTLFLFQEKTAFVNVRNKGNRLGKVYMNGFILRYFLIELVRVFHRAVFYTGRTTRAFVF